MPVLSFGQPVGGIIQVAYVVQDLDQAMKEFATRLKVGPWFVTGPFTPKAARYRGQPTDLNVTLALGFCGHMSFELIKQHNDVPSVFREIVERRGYGFHHWGVPTDDFDGDVAKYQAAGYDVAFSDHAPGGYRIAYMDTTRDLPGMIELMERNERLEARYSAMYNAAAEWDGTNLVRTL